MAKQYTDRVIKVMKDAQHVAGLLNDNYVGTEHILLAMLGNGGVAAAILIQKNVSADDILNLLDDGSSSEEFGDTVRDWLKGSERNPEHPRAA